MTSSIFINPRHSYADPDREKLGHVYLGSSAEVAIVKYNAAGANIERADENIRPVDLDAYDVIGVTAVGMPAIPEIRSRFCSTLTKKQTLLIGGQVVSGMNDSEFRQVFGGRKNVVRGDNVTEVSKVLGVDVSKLLQDNFLSLESVYEQISDEDMREYLSREMSFFLGQGCQYNCAFCAIAQKNVPESYRQRNITKHDIRYLMERAQKLGLQELKIYFSNLDLFQSPEDLYNFAKDVLVLRNQYPDFTLNLRGLSTIKEFCTVVLEKPDVVKAIRDAGLTTVGFGVDGNALTWNRVKKRHNTEAQTLDALQHCADFRLQAQTIFVSGFLGEFCDGIEKGKESMHRTVSNAQEMQNLFPNTDIRTHVAKLVFGDAYLSGKEQFSDAALQECVSQSKRLFLENPDMWTAGDFKASPSEFSHWDEEIRSIVATQADNLDRIAKKEHERIGAVSTYNTPEENVRIMRGNIGKFDY